MADSLLKRIELLILKNKSSSDLAQVPASGAACDVYISGTDVATSTILYGTNTDPPPPSSQPIPVMDGTQVNSGDTVKLGPTGLSLTIDYVNGNNVYVFYSQTNNTSVPRTTRLIQISHRAAVYLDKFRATQPPSPGTVYADSTGRVGFYVADARVDCLVSGSGFTSRIYADVKGGADSVSWLNAADFPSIQMAIDALPRGTGGTVFIPAGTYFLSDTLYTPCDRPCHLLGEAGALDPQDGGYQTGTVLRWSNPVGMIRLRGDASSIRSMTLYCDGVLSGTPAEDEGYGIMIGRRDIVDAHPAEGDAPGQTEYFKAGRGPLKTAVLEDVIVKNAAGWGLYIPGWGKQSDYSAGSGGAIPDEVGASEPGAYGGTLSIWIHCNRVQVSGSRTYGACFIGKGNTTIYMRGGALLSQGKRYIGSTLSTSSEYYCYATGCAQLEFSGMTFEGQSPGAAPSGSGRDWIRLVDTEDVSFRNSWFENDPASDSEGGPLSYIPTYFVGLQGTSGGCVIDGAQMIRAGLNGGLVSCVQARTGTLDVTIGSMRAKSSTDVWDVRPAFRRLFDLAPIDLAAADRVVCVGRQVLSCLLEHPVDERKDYPLLVVRPASATELSEAFVGVPEVVDSTLFPAAGDPAEFSRIAVAGAVTVNLGLAGESRTVGAGCVYCKNSDASLAGWRLMNNLPALTSAERDARDTDGTKWAVGDMIVNEDDLVPEIRNLASPRKWTYMSAVPNFVGVDLQGKLFADGELIAKEKTGAPTTFQLRVFLGGHWYAVDLSQIS